MSDRFIQALALSLDPAWRRLDPAARAEDGRCFTLAERDAGRYGVISHTYSSIGLESGVDLVAWRMADSLEALEEAAAALLGAGLGRWLAVRHSFLGRIAPSQYVAKPSGQEQSLFEGERSRYLVVYPFTKTAEWYLLGREARQGIMNEHMRVGRDFRAVRQLLAYSFGLDDQDFTVAYETDDLALFGELVRALRGTEGRRSTLRDTPILVGVHRPVERIVELLGATSAAAPVGAATGENR
jgi:chlorite dismutase